VRRALLLLSALVALLLASAPVAAAQDSDAPPGALPHWLPSEAWVYEHWLPYDEGRLYRLLATDRGAVWRHLRDDAAHNLEQLARRRGMGAGRLADRLVSPWRGRVSAARLARLRSRALRTITQGHLSQHILFHSLHQLTIPRHARSIFGVPRAEFLRLRRSELSPAEIGRLHGRSVATMRRRSIAALRATTARAVSGRAMTRRQARLLLDRQIRQVPRWLGQSRYNGPPRTIGPGRADLPPADWANRPSVSADGAVVVWDAYRARIPEARRRGEIRVVASSPSGGPLRELSHPARATGLPHSAYNSMVSADGSTVAFEVSAGNLNFAKRYGEMRVLTAAVGSRAESMPVSHAPGARGGSRSAFTPSISADGQAVAYLATEAGRGGAPSRNALWLADRRTGQRTAVLPPALDPPLEPRVSGDGRAVAFAASDAGVEGRALVHVRWPGEGRTELVSRADGADGATANADAHEPAPSHDGTVVAFTSSASNLGARGGRARVFVRDLASATTTAVSPAGTRAFDPAISPDGRFVAYAARRPKDSARAGRVYLHDRVAGTTALVSRGAAGPANGLSAEPALSADGRLVAFTSTASNLDRRKPGGLPGVFVRDVAAGELRLLSTHRRLPGRASAGAARAAGLLCHLGGGGITAPSR
jgi:Tol biopolymer transport system component